MNLNLYYVTGYHFKNNEWWRFVLTSQSETTAEREIIDHHSQLSRVSARYICETNEEIFQEL